MKSYLDLILEHGGKIVFMLNSGFAAFVIAGMGHGWIPPWPVFAVMGLLNALASYNATVVQPKIMARKLAMARRLSTVHLTD